LKINERDKRKKDLVKMWNAHFERHVYCTRCKWFRLDDEEIPYCPYEEECNIWDCEDSKPYRERPKYQYRNL
jgi:hypothetical protein